MYNTDGNLAYQEEPRTEIIGGKLVALAAPSTRHDDAVENIYKIFSNYLRGKLCRVFASSRAVYMEKGEVYEPDVKVVCDRSKVKPDGIHGTPDLVVEVLSPSTANRDKGWKMRVYERNGVREYWIVDPISQSVDQYVLEDGRFTLRTSCTLTEEVNLELLTEERRVLPMKEFPCAIFNDLTISLEKVFSEENW